MNQNEYDFTTGESGSMESAQAKVASIQKSLEPIEKKLDRFEGMIKYYERATFEGSQDVVEYLIQVAEEAKYG